MCAPKNCFKPYKASGGAHNSMMSSRHPANLFLWWKRCSSVKITVVLVNCPLLITEITDAYLDDLAQLLIGISFISFLYCNESQEIIQIFGQTKQSLTRSSIFAFDIHSDIFVDRFHRRVCETRDTIPDNCPSVATLTQRSQQMHWNIPH